ncbi:uncharacterized protein DEA37_0011733 [Paragonimus westermani]|uniref:N-end aminoacyl transferase N-terminal domain-containing protein n=1 Tax=Paragonimus westermani TaxID=34504 RepID=A0A5J4P137_9TREM|nr:uncharacterized protein DEA37_0011733 [Paragonimus westermani]
MGPTQAKSAAIVKAKQKDFTLLGHVNQRSGTYCYKPLNEVTCCPCYTIRCNALDFRPSRSQKRLLKMVASFLKTGEVFAKSHIITEDWRSDPIELPQRRTGEFLLDAKGDVPSSINTMFAMPSINPDVFLEVMFIGSVGFIFVWKENATIILKLDKSKKSRVAAKKQQHRFSRLSLLRV